MHGTSTSISTAPDYCELKGKSEGKGNVGVEEFLFPSYFSLFGRFKAGGAVTYCLCKRCLLPLELASAPFVLSAGMVEGYFG